LEKIDDACEGGPRLLHAQAQVALKPCFNASVLIAIKSDVAC